MQVHYECGVAGQIYPFCSCGRERESVCASDDVAEMAGPLDSHIKAAVWTVLEKAVVEGGGLQRSIHMLAP